MFCVNNAFTFVCVSAVLLEVKLGGRGLAKLCGCVKNYMCKKSQPYLVKAINVKETRLWFV